MSEVDRRVRKVKAYCAAMASRYLATRRRMVMVLPLIYDQKLVKRYNDSMAGHGVEVLREALMLGLVDDLVALTQDKYKTSASLVNIVRLLQDTDLRNAVKVDFCKPLHGVVAGNLAEREARRRSAEQARRFEELWISIVTGTNYLVDSDIGKKLKGVRDKVSSHYEMTAQGQEPRLVEVSDFGLKWGDPERYMEDAKTVIFDTVLLIANTSYHLEGLELTGAQVARAFWGIDYKDA